MSALPTRLNILVDPPHECARYDIYLNDIKQRDCTIADVVNGYIVRQMRHPLFKNILHHNGVIVTKRHEGIVRIELKS